MPQTKLARSLPLRATPITTKLNIYLSVQIRYNQTACGYNLIITVVFIIIYFILYIMAWAIKKCHTMSQLKYLKKFIEPKVIYEILKFTFLLFDLKLYFIS